MMPDVVCSDVCLWISDIGCGLHRRALLALEPGARIWIAMEGEPILFERMQDGRDGRSTRGLKPVGDNKDRWLRRYREERPTIVEFALIERPQDAGAGSEKYVVRQISPA